MPRQDNGIELAPRFKVTEATGGDLLTQDDATAQGIGSNRSPWSFAPGIALPNWNLGPLVQPWLDTCQRTVRMVSGSTIGERRPADH